MINMKKLDDITSFLKEEVFKNSDIMFLHQNHCNDEFETDLYDIIATLHNYLYEAVTGERYNYMFHWANKIGAVCYDNIFDDNFKYDNEGEEK